jgi:ribosomal-protein-alanine acetyltransferase
VGFLLALSPALTIFSFMVLPVSGWFIGLLTRRLRRDSGNSQDLLGSLLSRLEETISGIRIVRISNASGFMSDRFDALNKSYAGLLRKIFDRRDLANPVSEALGVMAVLSILYFGGTLVIEQRSALSASEFIAYILLFSQLLPPVKSLGAAYTNVQKGLASARRVFALLDQEPQVVERPGAVPLEDLQIGLEFRGVSFRYGEAWVLRDEDGDLLGYFLMMYAVEEVHLLNITVRPDRQGQGFGRKLLDKLIGLARDANMHAVLLEVRPSNNHALLVYHHLGFVQIGQRKNYYPAAGASREDAIVMRKML